jgi:hypothetical protein
MTKGSPMVREALKVSTDNRIEVVDLDATGDSYRVLKAAVGGPIEGAWFDGFGMYVNEEGKRLALAINPGANRIFQDKLGAHDVIVGDVIFIGAPDEEGDSLSLPRYVQQYIRAMVDVRD